MAAQEFHHFPKIPERVKVIVLKQLDLETLLSFALTAKNSVKLVRECRLTPSLVEIRMEEVERDPHRDYREEKKHWCRIDVSFEPGTFPEGYNNFTWNFVENSSEVFKYVQRCDNLERPTYVYDNYVLDDGTVLNNLYQVDNYVGCEVTPQTLDKVYSRIEDFLLKELFLPAKKVEVTAIESIVSDLGDAFSARNKLKVNSLTLCKKWKKTATLKRILEYYEVDKLVVDFTLDFEAVKWREISAPARAVLFSKSNLFEYYESSLALFPFHFQKAKIKGCDAGHFSLIVKKFLEGCNSLDQLSLLTAENAFCDNAFRFEIEKCMEYPWNYERVQNKFISQTDSTKKVVRVFHIVNGFELMNGEYGARAFCWNAKDQIRDDRRVNYGRRVPDRGGARHEAHFLVWSSKYSEVSEREGRQFIEEREREMERIKNEQEEEFKQRLSQTNYNRENCKVVNSINEHQVEIKEAQKRIEAYDAVLQNAPKIENEIYDQDSHDGEDKKEKVNPVNEKEIDDTEIIQKCLEHHPESSELTKLAPSYEFTLFTGNAGDDDNQRKFEIQIKNTANNKEMAIKFQYIAQLDKFEVFLNETQLGKNALTGIPLTDNQYCDRPRENACREIWLRLQTLFPSAEFSLTLRNDDRKKMPTLLSAQLKCTHVKLIGNWNTDELEKTLKCLEITKKMEFSEHFEVRWMPSEMPFVDEIVIDLSFSYGTQFSHWTPKCREIRVEHEAQMRMMEFLKHVILSWKNGELCSGFESMLIHFSTFNALWNDYNIRQLQDGFQGKPWDPSQRSGVFWKLSDSQEMVCHNLLEGLDFQRSSDGSLATLLISTDYHYNMKFIVWKKGEEFKAPRARDIEKWKTLDMEKLEQLQKKLVDMKKEAKVLRWKAHEEYRDRYRRSRVVHHDILDD